MLCNNAGVIGPTPLGPGSVDNWRWIVDVNILGVAHVINAFVPRMVARVGDTGGEAHIVNTASMAGLRAGDGWAHSAYGASKFAVVSMSRNLRGELAGSGIGVSVLCPGGVDTRIWEAGRNRPAERGGPETYERPDRLLPPACSTRWWSAATCCARSARTRSTSSPTPSGASRSRKPQANCSAPSIDPGASRWTDAPAPQAAARPRPLRPV